MAFVDFGDPVIHGLKLEDPDMKDKVQSLKLLISILRPLIRLLSELDTANQDLQVKSKHADELLQKVIQECQPLFEAQVDDDWESSPTNIQLLLSIVNFLKIIDGEIREVFDLLEAETIARINTKRAEQMLSLIDPTIQNLEDMLICRANIFIPVKVEIEELGAGLLLLRFFLRVTTIRLIDNDYVTFFFSDAGTFVLFVSRFLYFSFVEEEFNDGMMQKLLESLQDLILKSHYFSLIGDDIPTMDEQVLEFTDLLIHKLRKLFDMKSPSFIVAAKDLADNLIEDLSFLRCNLLDLLLHNSIKEMKSLIISTQDLIVETGIFIYEFWDTTEEDSMAEYCISKIPEVTNEVDYLKLEASDLYKKLISESWKSNSSSINVLDYADFLISKMEQLILRPEEAPVNALKPQIETAYEEIASTRKLLCYITELRSPWVESLLTRYKDAACQAEYAIDSFVAGERSVWCHKLGLFVVSKDVKILHKELKGILTMTIAAIPSLSRGDSLQANYPPDIGSKEDIHNKVQEAANGHLWWSYQRPTTFSFKIREKRNTDDIVAEMASVAFGDPVIHGVKPEDPDMKDKVQSFKLLISILRPFLSLLPEMHIESIEFQVQSKRADYLLQKVIQEHCQVLFEAQGDEELESSPTNIQRLLSILNILKIMDGEIRGAFHFFEDKRKPRINRERAEQMLSFIDPTLQNLEDMLICRANIFIPVKEEMEELGAGLLLLRFFLRVITNRLIKNDDVTDFFSDAGTFVLFVSGFLYFSFVEEEFDDGMVPKLLESLQDLIDFFGKIFRDESLPGEPDDIPTMDGLFLECIDFLIHKLRKLSGIKSPSFIVAAKDIADNLIEELSFLKCNLLGLLLHNPVKEMKSLIISTQDLIAEAGIFVYEFWDTTVEDSMCNSEIPDVIKKVDNLKLEASDLYKKFFSESWNSNFSSINVLDYANFLISKMEQLILRPEEAPVNALKPQIETAYEEIVSTRKLLCDITELRNSRVESLLTRYKDAACQAEYAIDSFVAGEGSVWCHKLGLFVVSKDVKILHKELEGILTMTIAAIPSLSSGDSLQANYPPDIGSKEEIHNRVEEAANKIVGLKDSEAEIIELLSGGSKQLKLVSIVGMPGLGKTTLANSVYKHPSIVLHFHVRAWCCVSQVYDSKNLLHEILGQIKIVGGTNQCNEIDGTDVAQELYQSLKGKKYLIVLDDIWDVEAWYGLEGILPDDNEGSRVLFTTRHKNLASIADSIQYDLCLLSLEESCKLLWLKLFDREACPSELSSVSTYIARKCKGLPLALVLVAGILKGTERKEDSWEQVAETLNSSLVANRKYWEILELSYKHLPDFLKQCFLYLGTFPADKKISSSKLIELWICEGFLQQQNLCPNSLEREAMNYLNDLVDRSLVMVCRRSSIGGIKECRIHDVIRDFCSQKFQDDKFLKKVHMFGGISILHGGLGMRVGSLLYYNRPVNIISRRWLDFPEVWNDCLEGRQEISERDAFRNRLPTPRGVISERDVFRNRLPTPRGGISETDVFRNRLPTPRGGISERDVFRNSDEPPRGFKELLKMMMLDSKTSQCRQFDYGLALHFKLLCVLDLEDVRVESSAGASDLVNIAKLVHLRYLAIRVHTNEIPSEICDLRNLETFVITGAIGSVILPEGIWNLVSLRHVLLTDHSFISFQHYAQDFFRNFSQRDNLKSISALSLCHGDDVEQFILRRLTGIQKLGCKFSNSWDDYTSCNLLPLLDFLSELESLKVFFSSKALYPCKFSFPVNLKKLSISSSRLPWDEISAIGQLPNLEVLKLLNKAFEGRQWDMREGEFRKLKFLKLDSLDIQLWNAYGEHLPCLEQLVLLNCQQLEVIPSSFGEIVTLELIEMKWCSSSATESVKQILEDQRDMSNNQLSVNVVGPLI